MEPTDRFKINSPHVVNEIIDNEVVIIDFDSGSYYSLDKTGATIWDLIQSGTTIADTIAAVADRYQSQRTDIEQAVIQLIRKLQQENLIVPDQTTDAQGAGAVPGTHPGGGETAPIVFEAPVLHKYTDMEELLLLDPIHDVDETGWPQTKPDPAGSRE